METASPYFINIYFSGYSKIEYFSLYMPVVVFIACELPSPF